LWLFTYLMDLLAQRSVTLASSWSEKMKSRKARSRESRCCQGSVSWFYARIERLELNWQHDWQWYGSDTGRDLKPIKGE
jgi:hypothetical protein